MKGTLMPIHILLLFVCTLLCGIANRWAGGLLSKWIGKDLGDASVRILWGLTTIVPLLIFYHHLRWVAWWMVFPIILTGVVQGLLRGAGWGNALSLGFVNGHMTIKTFPAAVTMFVRTLAMNAGIWIGVAVLMHADPYWAIPGLSACALLWVAAYLYAWLRPWNVPFMGMYKVDPPPTAEFISGAVTACLVYLYCWFT